MCACACFPQSVAIGITLGNIRFPVPLPFLMSRQFVSGWLVLLSLSLPALFVETPPRAERTAGSTTRTRGFSRRTGSPRSVGCQSPRDWNRSMFCSIPRNESRLWGRAVLFSPMAFCGSEVYVRLNELAAGSVVSWHIPEPSLECEWSPSPLFACLCCLNRSQRECLQQLQFFKACDCNLVCAPHQHSWSTSKLGRTAASPHRHDWQR